MSGESFTAMYGVVNLCEFVNEPRESTTQQQCTSILRHCREIQQGFFLAGGFLPFERIAGNGRGGEAGKLEGKCA